MVRVRIGESVLTGRISGLWNKEDKAFEVKRGTTKNGKKYQIFEMSVSDKDQDGNWTNGKGLKVMLWGDKKVDHGDSIGLVGRFKPDNWEKDGKTIYGNSFVVFEEGIFEPDGWDKQGGNNSQASNNDSSDDELPW